MSIGFISRILAGIVVGLLMGWLLLVSEQSKLAALDKTPPAETIAKLRETYSHGYAFHAVSDAIAVVVLVVFVEFISILIRLVLPLREQPESASWNTNFPATR